MWFLIQFFCFFFNVCVLPTLGQQTSELFGLPIHDLSSPLTIHAIEKAQKDLNENGAFILPNFLSNNVILEVSNLFNNIFISNEIVFPEVHRSIFQKHSIDNELSLNHPFNKLLYNRAGFMGRTILEKQFINDNENNLFLNLYNSTILQNFFSAITKSPIYPSNDKHGSIYGLVFGNNDVGAWHFDEHPFSCVWVIRKPQHGGNFKYVTMKPEMTLNGWKWNTDLISKILENDDNTITNNVKTINANTGDVYCFYGNVSMHAIGKVNDNSGNPMPRQVFVTAFSTEPNFKHSNSVHQLNDWDNKNKNNKNEL